MVLSAEPLALLVLVLVVMVVASVSWYAVNRVISAPRPDRRGAPRAAASLQIRIRPEPRDLRLGLGHGDPARLGV